MLIWTGSTVVWTGGMDGQTDGRRWWYGSVVVSTEYNLMRC
jgi:hypothetical protein